MEHSEGGKAVGDSVPGRRGVVAAPEMPGEWQQAGFRGRKYRQAFKQRLSRRLDTRTCGSEEGPGLGFISTEMVNAVKEMLVTQAGFAEERREVRPPPEQGGHRGRPGWTDCRRGTRWLKGSY